MAALADLVGCCDAPARHELARSSYPTKEAGRMAPSDADFIARWWAGMLGNAEQIHREPAAFQEEFFRQRNQVSRQVRYRFYRAMKDIVGEFLKKESSFVIEISGSSAAGSMVEQAVLAAGLTDWSCLFPTGCSLEADSGVYFVWTTYEPVSVMPMIDYR